MKQFTSVVLLCLLFLLSGAGADATDPSESIVGDKTYLLVYTEEEPLLYRYSNIGATSFKIYQETTKDGITSETLLAELGPGASIDVSVVKGKVFAKNLLHSEGKVRYRLIKGSKKDETKKSEKEPAATATPTETKPEE